MKKKLKPIILSTAVASLFLTNSGFTSVSAILETDDSMRAEIPTIEDTVKDSENHLKMYEQDIKIINNTESVNKSAHDAKDNTGISGEETLQGTLVLPPPPPPPPPSSQAEGSKDSVIIAFYNENKDKNLTPKELKAAFDKIMSGVLKEYDEFRDNVANISLDYYKKSGLTEKYIKQAAEVNLIDIIVPENESKFKPYFFLLASPAKYNSFTKFFSSSCSEYFAKEVEVQNCKVQIDNIREKIEEGKKIKREQELVTIKRLGDRIKQDGISDEEIKILKDERQKAREEFIKNKEIRARARDEIKTIEKLLNKLNTEKADLLQTFRSRFNGCIIGISSEMDKVRKFCDGTDAFQSAKVNAQTNASQQSKMDVATNKLIAEEQMYAEKYGVSNTINNAVENLIRFFCGNKSDIDKSKCSALYDLDNGQISLIQKKIISAGRIMRDNPGALAALIIPLKDITDWDDNIIEDILKTGKTNRL